MKTIRIKIKSSTKIIKILKSKNTSKKNYMLKLKIKIQNLKKYKFKFKI